MSQTLPAWLKSGEARVLLGRAGAALVLILGSWWVFSGLGQLQAVRRQLNEEQGKFAELTAKMEKLQQALAPKSLARVAARFAEAEKRIFIKDSELVDWVIARRREAALLGFDCQVTTTKPTTHPVFTNRVEFVPLIFRLTTRTNQAYALTPYHRLLRFCRTLAETKRRVDWRAIYVTGGTNSVEKAEVRLNAWRKKGPSA